MDGKMMLDGELLVFVIYQGEGEGAPIQWVEESIPFSGELDVPDMTEDMVPVIMVMTTALCFLPESHLFRWSSFRFSSKRKAFLTRHMS